MTTDQYTTVTEPVEAVGKPTATKDGADAWNSAKARVLHFINGEHYSGAERVQDLLAMRLPESGYQVGLACVKPKLFPKMYQAADARLYEVPMRSRFDLAALRELRRIIVEENYDILHAHLSLIHI